MGAYLTKPKTEKVTVIGQTAKLRYAASGMQGNKITRKK